MALRNTSGKVQRKPWTLDDLRSGFEKFFQEHGHYPTGPEIDPYPYLPTARSIERSFGGVIALRKELALGGQNDYRTGAHSSARAKTIGARAHKTESEVYTFLCERFSKELVHREYFFTDDARTRSDFFVYDNEGEFCVDVFYPSDRRNLVGCINNKLKKYQPEELRKYPMIFLQMNPDISEEVIQNYLANKTKKLGESQRVMSWGAFKAFCEKRRPGRVLRMNNL